MTSRSRSRRVKSFFAGVKLLCPRGKGKVSGISFQRSSIKIGSSNTRMTGAMTDSVALRLIYMWSEDKDRFEELRALLGPDGLGLLKQFDIVVLNRSVEPTRLEGDEAKTTVYMPVFTPSEQMGGAGRPFPFLGSVGWNSPRHPNRDLAPV